MEHPTIRLAVPSDTSRIGEVIRSAYAPWMTRLDDLPDVAGGIAGDVARGSVHVAELSGRIVGCLIATETDGALHVANLAVDPAVAGQGIGTRLMQHASERARNAGIASLRLSTHREMRGNVTFYERLGWTVTSRDGNKVIMSLSIGRD